MSRPRTTVLASTDDYDTSEQQFLASLEAPGELTGASGSGIVGSSSLATAIATEPEPPGDPLSSPSNANWRQEVATRVQDFRARRNRRKPDTQTLPFQFEPPAPDSWAPRSDAATVPTSQLDYYRSLTAQAVARLESGRSSAAALEETQSAPMAEDEDAVLDLDSEDHNSVPTAAITGEQYFGWQDGAAVPSAQAVEEPDTIYIQEPAAEGKIIEFPRPPVIIPPSSEELAEPVPDKPRILDVPEAVSTATAPLAGISLEPAEEEPFSSFQVDLPLAVASMSTRFLAGVLDALVVLVATVLYLVITLEMKVPLPSGKIEGGVLALMPLGFWMLYNYLFLVHAGATPAMKLSRLRITSFDGELVSRQLRRWRAITMGLSALSLGLGLLWAIFDEDTLCWHDRITRTYLTGE